MSGWGSKQVSHRGGRWDTSLIYTTSADQLESQSADILNEFSTKHFQFMMRLLDLKYPCPIPQDLCEIALASRVAVLRGGWISLYLLSHALASHCFCLLILPWWAVSWCQATTDRDLYSFKRKQDICYGMKRLTCMLMLSICTFGGKGAGAQNICWSLHKLLLTRMSQRQG